VIDAIRPSPLVAGVANDSGTSTASKPGNIPNNSTALDFRRNISEFLDYIFRPEADGMPRQAQLKPADDGDDGERHGRSDMTIRRAPRCQTVRTTIDDQASALSRRCLIIKIFFQGIVTRNYVRRFLFDWIDKGV
jgi:hypothetical protein